jgi:hypothetical protein
VRVFGPVVEPTSRLAIIAATEVLQSGTVGPEQIGHDGLRSAMPLHRFLQEFKGCLAIARLADDAFQHFTFVIDSAPKVVRHSVDLHVDLIQVPLPVAMHAHRLDTFYPALGSEHRAKSVPPILHSLMVNLDAALVQEIRYVAQRERETDVEHHRQVDDLRAGFEVAEGGAFGNLGRVAGLPVLLQTKFF